MVEVTGTAVANDQAPGGVEVTGSQGSRRCLARPRHRIDPVPARGHRRPADDPRPRAGHAAIRRWAGLSRSRRPAWPGSARPWTAWAAPKCTRRRSSSRPPSRGRTCSASLFGRPAYLAQSPQFFKQALVGVFERVFEVGGLPGRAARHGPAPGRVHQPRPSSASSPAITTSWRYSATRSPGWWPAQPAGRPAPSSSSGSTLPVVPRARSPRSTSRTRRSSIAARAGCGPAR